MRRGRVVWRCLAGPGSAAAFAIAAVLAPTAAAGCGAGRGLTATSSDGGGGEDGPAGDAATPSALASPIQPTFGKTATADSPPPPISGGTLIVLRDGHAVAADPDRDAVYVVDLGARWARTVGLQAGDQPGRLVEDGAGRVHVALRGGSGSVVTIDPATASVVDRRAVCPAPRGISWDPSTDLLWVACATGELAALPAAGGAAAHSFVAGRDLRDVVAARGALTVTRFRAAQVLHLNDDGTVARTDALYAPGTGFVPQLAWRVAPGPSGTLAVVHQEESTATVSTAQGGYGGCGAVRIAMPSTPIVATSATPTTRDGGAGEGGVAAGPTLDCSAGAGTPSTLPGSVTAALPLGVDTAPDGGLAAFLPELGCFEGGVVRSVYTLLGADGSVLASREIAGVLPVDLAVSPDGTTVAVVAPGNAYSPRLATVFAFSICGSKNVLTTRLGDPTTGAQPIAVAFDASGDLLVQAREPAQLWILGPSGDRRSITLSTASRRDAGHDLFHVQAGEMIACASCHPEGREDGHVWKLDGHPRRTPSLSGTIPGTAPYHWPGDFADLPTLAQNVYTVRMGGSALADAQLAALQRWVESLPPPPSPSWVDAGAASRGKALFERSDVACATCHAGARYTNNETMNVGTGAPYQVPPLVGVGWRTPLMHDGCATTLADRFGACSTPGHGDLSSLSGQDLSDLAAYLETL